MKTIWFVTLAALAILARTELNLGPNFELVTAVSIAAAMFISSRYSFVLVLAMLALSDLMIGNSQILVFTWSGAIIGHLIAKHFSQKHNPFKATLLGLLAVAIFFLWTNLGVVVLFPYYDHSLSGLMQSYANALPFLKPQIISAILFTPIIYIASQKLLALNINKPILSLWKNLK